MASLSKSGLRVFTKRTLKPGMKPTDFVRELQRIRNVAAFANGFEGSEHLTQVNATGKAPVFVVYSVWRSERDWEHWLQSPARLSWQKKVEAFVEGEEEHLVLSATDTSPAWVM